MVPLTCLTYNVRSLGQGQQGARKRRDLRNFTNHLEPKPEIILLQEIHMGIRDCMAHTLQLRFKGGREFWNESTYSASTGKYKGGTGILIAERLIPFIEENGVMVGSRAQYIMFRFTPNIKIGIVNLYGYN